MKFEADHFADNRAELIVNLTEEIELLLEEKDMSRSDLAVQINKSKSYISQVLSGSRNMTLNTLADICSGMKVRPADVFRRYVRSSDIIYRAKVRPKELTVKIDDFQGRPTRSNKPIDTSKYSPDAWTVMDRNNKKVFAEVG